MNDVLRLEDGEPSGPLADLVEGFALVSLLLALFTWRVFGRPPTAPDQSPNEGTTTGTPTEGSTR